MPDGTVMLDVRYADDCAYVVLAPSFDRLLTVTVTCEVRRWLAQLTRRRHIAAG